MKILAGAEPKSRGEIFLEGQPVTIDSPQRAMSLGISIIYQEFNLVPHLSAGENIFLGREPTRLLPGWIDFRQVYGESQRLMDSLGMPLDVRAEVRTLSVAQQQMVEIAKALSFDSTKILIMDEPTSAISISETQVLFRLIRSLRDRGVGIVYISHRMEELRQIADRVTVLRDGQYVGTRRMAEVTDDEIIAMMVGREISATYRSRQEVPANTAEVALEVRGLSTKNLLRDVSFEVRRGEILGFAGLMGAGRTETARAVIGADPVAAGTVAVRGKQVRITGPEVAVRHGIGYLPEDRKRHGLMLEQDVAFNVAMASLRANRGPLGFLRQGRTRKVTEHFIRALRIKTPSSRTTVKTLSGGNQQKVVIAKWLARDCDVLIFDELTRGIDVGAKEEIYKLLNDLADQGKAVVVISSELPEVLRLSHRIVVMSQGRVTGVLTPDKADQETIMKLATQNLEEVAA
jgi:ribose transport system ATP-binding protein